MIFKNSLPESRPVRELSSPRLDWLRVGLSASCPVSGVGSLLGNSPQTNSRLVKSRTGQLAE